jgi:hypothetical protein
MGTPAHPIADRLRFRGRRLETSPSNPVGDATARGADGRFTSATGFCHSVYSCTPLGLVPCPAPCTRTGKSESRWGRYPTPRSDLALRGWRARDGDSLEADGPREAGAQTAQGVAADRDDRVLRAQRQGSSKMVVAVTRASRSIPLALLQLAGTRTSGWTRTAGSQHVPASRAVPRGMTPPRAGVICLRLEHGRC